MVVVCVATSAVVFLTACAHRGPTPPAVRPAPPEAAPPPVEEGWTEKGIASWYGEPYHGRRTASGEIYDMHELTAAHKTLAFGSLVKVTRRDTGADVKVRINDRGPFIEGRIIDLSYAAAKKIDLDVDGVAPVKIKVVGRAEAPRKRPRQVEEATSCLWVQVGAFQEKIEAFKKLGAEALIAGCTEIPLLLDHVHSPVPFFDPTLILAKEAICFSYSGTLCN